MAFDAQRARVVMFGGTSSSGELQDTWIFTGTTWVELATTGTRPPTRVEHAMAYDSVRQRVVLFGGANLGFALSDTWEWNGGAWTQVALTGTTPPAYRGHAMAFDSTRNRTLLFGGGGGTATYQTATWEWDGATWVSQGPVGSGPPREFVALAFDSRRGRTVMFGGSLTLTGATTHYDETYEWSGTSPWVQIPITGTRPTLRRQHAMAYDSVRGRVVLFGGANGMARNSQTWEYGP